MGFLYTESNFIKPGWYEDIYNYLFKTACLLLLLHAKHVRYSLCFVLCKQFQGKLKFKYKPWQVKLDAGQWIVWKQKCNFLVSTMWRVARVEILMFLGHRVILQFKESPITYLQWDSRDYI